MDSTLSSIQIKKNWLNFQNRRSDLSTGWCKNRLTFGEDTFLLMCQTKKWLFQLIFIFTQKDKGIPEPPSCNQNRAAFDRPKNVRTLLKLSFNVNFHPNLVCYSFVRSSGNKNFPHGAFSCSIVRRWKHCCSLKWIAIVVRSVWSAFGYYRFVQLSSCHSSHAQTDRQTDR